LGVISAPDWEGRDITGDGVDDLMVYLSVHAGQELLTYAYELKGCAAHELLSDYSYPAAPPATRLGASGVEVVFSYIGHDGACADGGDDEGFVRVYRYNGVGFTLADDKPFRRLYPLYPAVASGGAEAERAAAELLGPVKIYDHLAADLDGDGAQEVAILYRGEEGFGALLVAARERQGFKERFRVEYADALLSLEGAVRSISAADLTGEGGAELVLDASADLGCQLDTLVIRFSRSGPELLLRVRRPLKERAQLRSKEISYRETISGMEHTWRWDGKSFNGPAGENFSPTAIAP
jgi:hypothetical protein